MKKDKPIFVEKRPLHHFRDNSQFYQWCHFNGNLMVSNNINQSFSLGLLAFILQPLIQRHMYQASFLAFTISVHSVFKPVSRPLQA